MPVGKAVTVGAWEAGTFIGAVVFSWGANPNIGAPWKLEMTEVAELVRVAFREHKSPVSRIVPQAVALLHERSPGLRLLVSFADPAQGHQGVIYQAMNWMYTGETSPKRDLVLNGKPLNRRAYTGRQFGKPGSRQRVPSGARWVDVPGKHRYVLPLDRAVRRRVAGYALPYPKTS
jgi:hypothetical protein